LLLLTFPGDPSIYYGDEVGLIGALDPDSRRGFPMEQQ
jgi:glycosidase